MAEIPDPNRPVPEDLRRVFADTERMLKEMRRLDPEGFDACVRDQREARVDALLEQLDCGAESGTQIGGDR